jgi:GntR family transcriptional regulator/MocR family aminotransferase
MELFVDPTKPRAVTRSLYEQIRTAIATGRITAGERLPSSRRLAEDLGVARQTIATVYARLTAEGHVIGRGAAGSFVADTAGTAGTLRPSRAPRAAPSALEPRPGLPDLPLVPSDQSRFDLRSGTPDLALFPHAAWRRAVLAAAHQTPSGYGDFGGLPELRQALARRAWRTRGVVADPEQIVVTAGAQAAIDLTIRLLTRPGDVVAVEEPGYPPVRRLIESLDRRVALVPVDAAGIRPESVPAHARVVYTTPSHQSPTGATLTVARRRALLAHADRHHQAIIEDDYDSEHRHTDRPLEPLHLLDTTGRVIHVATFSKTLAPSIRLGYAVFPIELAHHAVALRATSDVQPSELVQRAVHHLVTSGDLERHLRRTRKIYAERHAAVAEWVARMSAAGHLTPWATDHAGLHVTTLLHRVTEVELATRLQPHGVRLGSYGDTWARPPDHEGVIIGFGNADTDQLVTALGHVEQALTGPTR